MRSPYLSTLKHVVPETDPTAVTDEDRVGGRRSRSFERNDLFECVGQLGTLGLDVVPVLEVEPEAFGGAEVAGEA